MVIMCTDSLCEERATLAMQIPAEAAEYCGIAYVERSFCLEHCIQHMEESEWRKVRRLFIEILVGD